MLKKELRKKYKELRQQITEDTLVDKSLAIANRILQLDVWGIRCRKANRRRRAVRRALTR